FSGAVLVKIAKDNLSPVKFAEVNNLSPTNVLLAARYSVQNHGSDIVKTSLQKFAYHDQAKAEDFLLATEKIDHYLKAANEFKLTYNGAALINENNEVVGLMFDSGRNLIDLALPAYYLKSAINNFLVNSQEIIRSSLGVYYIDLAEAIGLSHEVSEGRTKGAVLLGSSVKNVLAVEPGSAAAEAGLEAGDIVIKVNGEEVDEKNSLTKLIQDYTPGQEISLTIVRAGEEMEIKLILGEI
ncbi:MAG TPA: PDZ domain-containing protein, partial [Patescibacteria group bacterium]|nr:PDZ domain-containing protein [Patescibacteria group bacterium]